PQQIKIFKREDVPFSMGLVIDNSGKIRAQRTAVELAALAIIKDSKPQDEAFIINFHYCPANDGVAAGKCHYC
ncbi:MAG: hypothetical protein WBM24_14720, partial [Candidatus Sulfotelmatobacter sp.]